MDGHTLKLSRVIRKHEKGRSETPEANTARAFRFCAPLMLREQRR
jgi:hypothetical protein